jgi:uncharacterized protein (DUF433 family)
MVERTENQWIVATPGVQGGRPCLRGTRLTVSFILELFASGATIDSILETYPQTTHEGLSSALRHAAKSLKNDVIWDVKIPA